MLYNIRFKVVHIESINNDIAYALSRFQMSFRSLAPRVDQFPTKILEEV